MSENNLDFEDCMFDLVQDLGACAYLLRLMDDYGDRAEYFTENVKQRAYEFIRGYQEQYTGELAFHWGLHCLHRLHERAHGAQRRQPPY